MGITGGSIGAGLFVGSGGAFSAGGPGSVVSSRANATKVLETLTHSQLIGFLIVGSMLLFTVQALGELAVLYPVNGAFFTYGCRFIDEAWCVVNCVP